MNPLLRVAVATLWAAGNTGPEIVLRHHAASFEGRPRWHASSGDCYHFAYLSRIGGEEYWFVDGKKAGPVPPNSVAKPFRGDDTALVRMSWDGGVLAFVQDVFDDSGRPLGVAVSVNGVLGEHAYERIPELVVSRTGGSVAYMALHSDAYRVVHNGVEGPTSTTDQLSLTFAREGGNLAYVQQFEPAKWSMVLNHQRMQAVPYMASIAFTPGLERWALATSEEGGSKAMLGGKQVGRTYNTITGLTISADGKRVGFFGRDGGEGSEFQAVVDGVEVGPRLDANDRAWPFMDFAPLSNAAYWTAQHAGASKLFVDGKPQGSWDSIFSEPRVSLSPRGRHFAYAARKGDSTYLVVDGKSLSVEPFRFFAISGIAFDNEEEFHYLELSPGGVTLVCGSVTKEPTSSICPRTARRLYPKKKGTDRTD